jgi:hypothetical protein
LHKTQNFGPSEGPCPKEFIQDDTGAIMEQFQIEVENGSCNGCGLKIYGKAYNIPGVAGLHCAMDCIEAHLFGFEACRWCGSEMLKTYTGIDSRLCSDGCSQNYYKYVAPRTSDQSARLGSGKRFMHWLQINQAETYALLVGAPMQTDAPKLGRPTNNGHTMTAAERKRHQRRKTLVAA